MRLLPRCRSDSVARQVFGKMVLLSSAGILESQCSALLSAAEFGMRLSSAGDRGLCGEFGSGGLRAARINFMSRLGAVRAGAAINHDGCRWRQGSTCGERVVAAFSP